MFALGSEKLPPSRSVHSQELRTSSSCSWISGVNARGILRALVAAMTFNSVNEIRAWQAAYAFKLAVYDLIRMTSIARDFALRDQLRGSAASAVSQLEEGYARFHPKVFGRMAVGATASIAEASGHLRDAVDSGHISEDVRATHDTLARETLKELVRLIEYLQSPEAEENARRIKAKRAEHRAQRRAAKKGESSTENPEPGTRN
jgi:four helix bundle protein